MQKLLHLNTHKLPKIHIIRPRPTHFVSYNKYSNLCIENNINRTAQNLSKYFHSTSKDGKTEPTFHCTTVQRKKTQHTTGKIQKVAWLKYN